MREVDVNEIIKNIKEMCIEANHFLSKDMKEVYDAAAVEEESPLGRQILGQLQENLQIAGEDMIPICQDTGMALSGNLANFAGGLIILLFKPFKVGDYIEAQGTGGTVKEIQIFHTILATPDNKMVYIPNGSLSSGAVTNFSRQATRRVDWTFGVDYGEDYDKVKAVIETIIARDSRILTDPAPFIALHALADSSVNIVVRVWVESPKYWEVYFGINQAVYATFNEKGINFPFPQLTVHRADN